MGALHACENIYDRNNPIETRRTELCSFRLIQLYGISVDILGDKDKPMFKQYCERLAWLLDFFWHSTSYAQPRNNNFSLFSERRPIQGNLNCLLDKH